MVPIVGDWSLSCTLASILDALLYYCAMNLLTLIVMQFGLYELF